MNDNGTINIEIETGFTTDFEDNYQYKLEALNDENLVLAIYQGSDSLINLNISESSNIHFKYIDIGVFCEEEKLYNEETLPAISEVKTPALTFDATPEFNGKFYILNYPLDSIYDLTNTKLDLIVVSNLNTYNQTIEKLINDGQIILYFIDGESNEISVSGTLTFKDEKLNKYKHTINIGNYNFNLSYSFNVNSFRANYTRSYTGEIEFIVDLDYVLHLIIRLNIHLLRLIMLQLNKLRIYQKK